MKITWSLGGKRGTIHMMQKMSNDLHRRLKKVVKKSADLVAMTARKNCPVAPRAFKKGGETIPPGHLKQSIKSFRRKLTGYIGTDVNYARFVEFGTIGAGNTSPRQQKAQPYIYPAVRARTPYFHAETKRAVRDAEKKFS